LTGVFLSTVVVGSWIVPAVPATWSRPGTLRFPQKLLTAQPNLCLSRISVQQRPGKSPLPRSGSEASGEETLKTCTRGPLLRLVYRISKLPIFFRGRTHFVFKMSRRSGRVNKPFAAHVTAFDHVRKSKPHCLAVVSVSNLRLHWNTGKDPLPDAASTQPLARASWGIFFYSTSGDESWPKPVVLRPSPSHFLPDLAGQPERICAALSVHQRSTP